MEHTNTGRILRDLRGGASAESVAAATGISVSSVYAYEGGRKPSTRNQYKLAEHFGTTIDAIFGREGNNNAEGN